MTIQSDGLSNSVIGGKNLQRNAIRFQAQYSSPLAAFRCYVIDNYAGYFGGTGGEICAALFKEESFKPGLWQSFGTKISDPEFPDPSSNRGRFPLVVFTTPVTLIQGRWYWIAIGNKDLAPDVNYFSMDYLENPKVANQVPTMQVYASALNGPYVLVPNLIPSPFVLHYANGLFQGLGWIGLLNGALECGAEYGFPSMSCVGGI